MGLSHPKVNHDHKQAVNYPTLQEITEAFQAINNKEDFSQLTNTLLEKTTQLSQAKAAALLLVNKNTGELEIVAVRQVPEEVITAYLQQPVRAAMIGEFYQRLVDPFETSFQFDGIRDLAAAGYSNYVVLPIRIRQKIIGYLTLSSDEAILAHPDSQEKFKLVLEFSAQTIESAYFIYQLKQQNAHLELMMTKLQNTKNHLKRTEKMVLVGQLAASVAHEIRNPLTIIGTSLQLTFDKMSKDSKDYDLFETMIAKVRTVDQTIKELMNFARPVQLSFKAFDLNKTVERVLTFVSRKFEGKQIRINKDLPNDLPQVFLDQEQTERLLINLLLNAYTVLEAQGSVTIQAGYEYPQSWLQLKIADTGPGIPQDQLLQIFNPFFTTRQEGSGLGLFLVKNLIEEMNGSIIAKNQEPQGAVFILSLPIAQ